MLDFKSQARPQDGDRRLPHYHQQLLIYAHILEHRYDKTPDRLALYWTGEACRDDALMFFNYEPHRVAGAGAYFDGVVQHILARDFEVSQPPDHKVCAECDFRTFCKRTGVVP